MSHQPTPQKWFIGGSCWDS